MIINTNDKNTITLYPNPVVNTLNVSTDYDVLNIYDISGKLVKTSNTNSSVDVSNLENGVYIVSIDGITKRIVKR